jgi:hypothetical protein
VPEQVIPMRMRREACHNGLTIYRVLVRHGLVLASIVQRS